MFFETTDEMKISPATKSIFMIMFPLLGAII
jgi:hypothetical protein